MQQLNQVQLLQAKITAITSQLQLKTGPAPNATPTTQPHGITNVNSRNLLAINMTKENFYIYDHWEALHEENFMNTQISQKCSRQKF